MEIDGMETQTNPIPVRESATHHLDRAWQQFSLLSGRIDQRDLLLPELGAQIMSASSSLAVYLLRVDSNNSDQTELQLLASRDAQVPANVEQWATSVGLKCVSSGQSQSVTITDSDSTPIKMIATPIVADTDREETVVALFHGGESDSLFEMALVRAAAHCVGHWDSRQQLVRTHRVAEDLAAINELVSRIEESASCKAGCQRIADELAKPFAQWTVAALSLDALPHGNNPHDNNLHDNNLDVYIALATEKDALELVAVSNRNSVPQDSQRIEYAESAMSECLSRNRLSQWPPSTDRHALLCHRQFAKQFSSRGLISVPLHNTHGDLQGVLLIASKHALPERVRAFVSSCATPVASSLGLLKKAQPPRLQQWLHQAKESILSKKTTAIMFLVGVTLCLASIPMPLQVSTDCEIHPSTKRWIAAPFAGHLEACLVRPGDMVTTHQVVASMDGREIALELAEVEAELHRAEKTRDGHVASHDSGKARVAQFEAKRLRARYDLLTHRKQSLELRSPISGIVISGDHKKAVGIPLKTGQSLIEIAPLDDLVVELSIPEEDMRLVHPGMPVNVRLDAFPFEDWQGTVERVHPASEIRREKNVFVATVVIPNPTGKLRPGMRGSAKIQTAPQPVGWNFLRKPITTAMRWLGW